MRLANRIFRRFTTKPRFSMRPGQSRRNTLELSRLEDRSVPAIISGTVFHDLNNSGILDAGEVGVAGQKVFLDTNNNGVLDAVNSTNTFNAMAGPYPFAVPGTPSFAEDPVTVTGTAPGTIADIDVTVDFSHEYSGDVAIRLVAPDGTEINLMGDGVNFGGFATSIQVTFDDQAPTTVPTSGSPPGTYKPISPLSIMNGKMADGVWKLKFFDVFPSSDTGALNSWSITITTAVGEVQVTTGSNGDYSIPGLADGSYNVRHNAPAGLFVTNTPVNGPQVPNEGQTTNVTITGGADVTGQNFGRLEQNSIVGRVVHDYNGNSAVDAGDSGLANRVVFNDLNNNGTLDGPSVSLGTTGLVPDNTTVDFFTTAAGFIGNVTNVRVVINEIKMTWVGDIAAVLIAPDGFTQAKLWTNKGGSGDNFIGTIIDDSASSTKIGDVGTAAPFTGIFAAEESMSIFAGLNGANLNGQWTLRLSDNVTGDQATVNSWTLQITTDNMADIPEPSTTTGPDGNYQFINQTPGPFNIRAVTPAGWNRISPMGPATGNLPAGKAATANFYEALQNAIYGQAYQDVDESLSLNAGDAPLSGAIIFDDANTNGKLDRDIWNAPNVPAPLVDGGFMSNSLGVADYSSPITDVNVTLSINHTWVGDLVIRLISPQGTSVTLFADPADNNGDNFDNVTFDDSGIPIPFPGNGTPPAYSGTYAPIEPLSILNGENANGVWTLAIDDVVFADTGSLLSWSIQFNNGANAEPVAYSDANGNYILTNVTAGSHKLGRLAPPNFLATNDPAGGFHNVTLAANGTEQNRNFGFVPDPTPVATGSATNVSGPGTTHVVTVVYTDTVGKPTPEIDVSKIGLDDIQVKAPNGMFLTPTSFVATPNTNAGTVSVDYTIPALGGSWDNTDNGIYEIQVLGGKVFDNDTGTSLAGTGPFSVKAGTVATFIVGLDTTYVVGQDGNLDDNITTTPADTSIVEALRLANSDFGNTTITFAIATGSATMAKTVNVNENLTITGPAGGFTITGSGSDRIFNVNIPSSTFVLENLTLSGGNAVSGDGGAILAVDEDITLNNVTLSANSAFNGSAIAFSGTGGSLTMNMSTATGNNATNTGTFAFLNATTVTLNNSTMTGNTVLGAAGGIYAYSGEINLIGSTISNNTSVNVGSALATINSTVNITSKSLVTGNIGQGVGAIYTYGGTLDIENSTVSNNTSSDNGGGLLAAFTTVTITNSTFSGNSTKGLAGGGAMALFASPTTIIGSTISGNTAESDGVSYYGGYGGGIIIFGGAVTTTVKSSTISGNTAKGGGTQYYGGIGGGVAIVNGTLNFINSTVSGNVADRNTSLYGGGQGGAVAAVFGTPTITLQNSTLAFNTASDAGGNISEFLGALATVTVSSSIVSNGTAPIGPDVNNVTPITATFSLFGNTSGAIITADPSNFLNVDPQLGALALNGAPPGSPQTHKPAALSPVIDSGFNFNGPDDQRNGQRTVDNPMVLNAPGSDGTDIGAVELQAAPTVTILTNGQVSGQHSLVTSIVIDFDQPVLITNPSTAFTIFRTFNSTAGDTATGTVGYDVSGLDVNNYGTSVTLTFNNSGTLGVLDGGGSLRDGKYLVTVVAAGITGLDTGMAANQTANTWRLFGDGNGDGVVNAADFNDFRLYYGSTNSIPGAIYDFNDDGLINAADFNAFRIRYGTGGYNMP